MNLVWVTSFAQDMYKVSGKPLIDSYVNTRSDGQLVCVVEGVRPTPARNVSVVEFNRDGILPVFLKRWAEFIPRALGGTNPGVCRCPGGPLAVHDKKHVMPCIGHWFCRNASRWFRKIAALTQVDLALREKGVVDPVLIWIDADCRFQRRVPMMTVRSWFVDGAAIFYHKDKRAFLEAGVVGYWMDRGADIVLARMTECYMSGEWVKMPRWDDCCCLQTAMAARPDVKSIDIACGIGDHSKVIDFGPVGPWVGHFKGRHGRQLGIMT